MSALCFLLTLFKCGVNPNQIIPTPSGVVCWKEEERESHVQLVYYETYTLRGRRKTPRNRIIAKIVIHLIGVRGISAHGDVGFGRSVTHRQTLANMIYRIAICWTEVLPNQETIATIVSL